MADTYSRTGRTVLSRALGAEQADVAHLNHVAHRAGYSLRHQRRPGEVATGILLPHQDNNRLLAGAFPPHHFYPPADADNVINQDQFPVKGRPINLFHRLTSRTSSL
ncbi:hypothetical protein [Anaeroselena agilis]|uniref:hypothetical protein n=1 Tax=Anaeroselena agilis TaxID=3063788 RepID=UPI0039B6FE95